MSNRFARLAADRRGVALPVALFGLVAVSLLVTTALLTSSTEYAISAAHRTAAGSLYTADAALEQYVFDRAQAGGIFMTPTQGGVAQGPGGKTYQIQVARLAWTDDQNPPAGTVAATETFSLVALPQDGRGRGVGAFLNLRRSFATLNTNINAGATSGGDLTVSGNATISDGRSGTNYCGTANNTSDYAVQVTAGSRINLSGNADDNLEGATNVTDYDKSRLAENILGPGVTLTDLADRAQIKFGARWDSAAYATTPINEESGTNPKYRWGCPAVLGVQCPSAASAAKHVVVAIDAGGGSVRINGRYGQGMIIVLNGSLEIQGNFTYKGIILVEKDMFIRGGQAGEESKIEGGVIAFGSSSTVEDNITGTATIKFNRCAVRDAERALNAAGLQSAPQQRAGSTFAWYELIR
ncbi:MAG: hypothetical protein KY467_04165 [Gemmatimonadetes bacterium]|nr:hypothetical protein [Gemmatimonadota bacterium]